MYGISKILKDILHMNDVVELRNGRRYTYLENRECIVNNSQNDDIIEISSFKDDLTFSNWRSNYFNVYISDEIQSKYDIMLIIRLGHIVWKREDSSIWSQI